MSAAPHGRDGVAPEACGDVIVLRWPSWMQVRGWIRGVLGVRGQGDEGEVLRTSQARRYDDVSRCC